MSHWGFMSWCFLLSWCLRCVRYIPLMVSCHRGLWHWRLPQPWSEGPPALHPHWQLTPSLEGSRRTRCPSRPPGHQHTALSSPTHTLRYGVRGNNLPLTGYISLRAIMAYTLAIYSTGCHWAKYAVSYGYMLKEHNAILKITDSNSYFCYTDWQ